MSIHQTKFYSNTLQVLTTVEVILPEPKVSFNGVEAKNIDSNKVPVIWLLHGLTDDQSAWLRFSNIERYANDYGYAVIMPSVGRSFYADMVAGPAYWQFITDELYNRMQYFYPISPKREDNFVAGLSMGGYGALKYGLNYPERFSAIGALSPVVDIESIGDNEIIQMKDWPLIFGDNPIKNTINDIDWLLSTANPKANLVDDLTLYTSAGDTDFLLEENLLYKDKFQERFGNKYSWHEGIGGHEWNLWDTEIQNFLKLITKTK